MSKSFFAVFTSVLFLIVGCGITAALIAFFGSDPLTPAQQKLFDAVLTLFVLGAGAIIGMISGRASATRPQDLLE